MPIYPAIFLANFLDFLLIFLRVRFPEAGANTSPANNPPMVPSKKPVMNFPVLFMAVFPEYKEIACQKLKTKSASVDKVDNQPISRFI
jgi:hypothetical protein